VDASSGFLGGSGGGDSALLAGDWMWARSGFFSGSGGPTSADAGGSIWGRAGLATCVLYFLDDLLTGRASLVIGLDRSLTGRAAFVNVLAALALVNFGTRGCDCASAHFDLSGLGDPA
jgi:hypothetical protein